MFSLLDDESDVVFQQVLGRIVGYGKRILPELEICLESSLDNLVYDRINYAIHKINYTLLIDELRYWAREPVNNLISGSLFVAKYSFPRLDFLPYLNLIDKIKRNVWIELNEYYTPQEEANVLGSVLYNFFNLKGINNKASRPEDFCINQVLEKRKGHPICNGIIYQTLCEQLGVNARMINIPEQTIIAYYQESFKEFDVMIHSPSNILFYVDASNGLPFSKQDMHLFLKRREIEADDSFFLPLSHNQIIQLLLKELGNFYAEEDKDKMDDFLMLSNALE